MQKLSIIIAIITLLALPLAALSTITDNGDSTLTDSETGLIWQQSAGPALNWNAAETHCGDFSLGGYPDWRLPILTELQALIDDTYDPEINPLFQIERGGFTYWSSDDFTSSSDRLSDRAYAVSFVDGYTLDSPKGTSHRVRCVTDATCNATWQGSPVTWQGECPTW